MIGLLFYCDRFRHLVCKPYSISNLHIMAQQLDIKKCWFHKNHYDIPKRRIKEIQSKCNMVSRKEIYNIIHMSWREQAKEKASELFNHFYDSDLGGFGYLTKDESKNQALYCADQIIIPLMHTLKENVHEPISTQRFWYKVKEEIKNI